MIDPASHQPKRASCSSTRGAARHDLMEHLDGGKRIIRSFIFLVLVWCRNLL